MNEHNTSLRVMTNNVKRGKTMAERAGLMVGNYLRYQPDILGLQECDPPDAYEYVIKELLERYALVGSLIESNGENSRTPILYRKEKFDLVEQRSDLLEDRYVGTNSKTYSVAVLREKETGKLFAVLNVHCAIIVSWYPPEVGTDAVEGNAWRVGNAKQIVSFYRQIIEKYGNIPVVLTGDFNSNSRSDPYQILAGTFSDSLAVASDFRSKPTATFHKVGQAPDPDGLPVDFVFVSKGNAEVLSCEILSDADMLNSTDHCAVLAELKI